MSSRLWIGNIAPGTTDEEVVQFVNKYFPDLQCEVDQRVEGDGSRPAAVVHFLNAQLGDAERAQMRLHGMYWKERQLYCYTPQGL
jgi:hypothetical protein